MEEAKFEVIFFAILRQRRCVVTSPDLFSKVAATPIKNFFELRPVPLPAHAPMCADNAADYM